MHLYVSKAYQSKRYVSKNVSDVSNIPITYHHILTIIYTTYTINKHFFSPSNTSFILSYRCTVNGTLVDILIGKGLLKSPPDVDENLSDFCSYRMKLLGEGFADASIADAMLLQLLLPRTNSSVRAFMVYQLPRVWKIFGFSILKKLTGNKLWKASKPPK